MKSAICSGCGRTIENNFLYCPWCGHSRIVKNDDSLDLMFNKLAESKKASRRNQLYQMEQELDNMEQELSVLVLSAEMHK
ncbi:MAG: zinc ribbon domain-containing protein [Treponema sp.]|nr:zinc ribbon domain-containing protein [Treponema sp.]